MRATVATVLFLAAFGPSTLAAQPALPAGPAGVGQSPPTTQPIVRSGPLAGLPSTPGATVAKIKALGDNE